MDPNANIRELLAAMKKIVGMIDDTSKPEDLENYSKKDLVEIAHTANRMCDLIDGLDGWMKGGGVLPDRWMANRK